MSTECLLPTEIAICPKFLLLISPSDPEMCISSRYAPEEKVKKYEVNLF